MTVTMGELVAKALPREERYKCDLVELLRPGGVVVIVGGRSTNFTEAMRRDPRLVFWDSTDPKVQHKDLPSNCRAVLFTPWMSHEWDGRIRRQADRRGIFCKPGMHTSGELRAELQRVVDHAPPKPKPDVLEELFEKELAKTKLVTPSEPVVVPDPVVVSAVEPVTESESKESGSVVKSLKARSGALARLIRAQANLNMFAAHTGLERHKQTERMRALARKQGLTTTLATVTEMLRQEAKRQGIVVQSSRRPVHEAAEKPTPVVPPTVAPQPVVPPVVAEGHPAVVEQMVASAQAFVAGRKSSAGDSLLQAIGEAERYIGDMQAAAALLADLMPRLKAAIADFKERQRKAAEIFLD